MDTHSTAIEPYVVEPIAGSGEEGLERLVVALRTALQAAEAMVREAKMAVPVFQIGE